MHHGGWGYQLPEDHECVQRGVEVVQGDERDLQPQPQDQRVLGDGTHLEQEWVRKYNSGPSKVLSLEVHGGVHVLGADPGGGVGHDGVFGCG